MTSDTSRLDELRVFAEQNFGRHIAANRYPGRGLAVGRLTDGEWAQVYWIMGRSTNSRNRRFVVDDGGTLRTEARDPSMVEDPSLIIYEAMLELPDRYIVSNGDQTRTIYDAIAAGGSMEDALSTREREPDAPNYTPRIAGLLERRVGERVGERVAISILRANASDPEQTDRATWRLPPPPAGLGYAITTYRSDGNPLPSYAGDPLWLPLAGAAEDVADLYWNGLDEENRIAMAVKVIGADGRSRIVLRQD